MLCLTSSERLYLREELCTPKLYLLKILSGGSLCGKSCVDELVKILLCEIGNVELGARTSKHIIVFAYDPLSFYSLSLIYIVSCIILIAHSYLYDWLCLFVCLTCV